jgi:uncharacterized protein (TIGR02284 family)
MPNEHDIRVLQQLVEITLDSARGYAEAAQDARDRRFGANFQAWAGERQRLVYELEQQIRLLGGEPRESGSALASAHRLFVSLRQKLGAGDKAVIEEVERGEDHVKAKYEQALEDATLGAATRLVIEKAYGSVLEGHDEARALQQGAASG